MLGGTVTNGGVNFPGLFHAWGRQVIAGIGWELVTRRVVEAGGTLPNFAGTAVPHWQHHVRVNSFLYAALCDEAVVDAGVDTLMHTMLARVVPDSEANGWLVTLCTKCGLTSRRTAILIDATGDANVTALAGFRSTLPIERSPRQLRPARASHLYGHRSSRRRDGRAQRVDWS